MEEVVEVDPSQRRSEGRTSLVFDKDFGHRDVLLLEVSEELLAKLKDSSGELVVRGKTDDPAVLCTTSETYSMRLLETSNTCLLLEGDPYALGAESSDGSAVVTSLSDHTFELSPVAPRVNRLRELLAAHEYRGPEEESRMVEKSGIGRSTRGVSLFELLDIVQCSEGQLDRALVEMNAIKVGGGYRTMSLEYTAQVLSDILAQVKERGWLASAVPEAECVEHVTKLHGHPEFAVISVLRSHSVNNPQFPIDDSSTPSDTATRSLEAAAVCVTCAETVFRAAESFPIATFEMLWRDACEPIVPDLSMLKGTAVEEMVQGQPHVVHFPASSLPSTPLEMFYELFTRQPRWKHSDILPYVERVTELDKDASYLLVKFARKLPSVDGEAVYCSRATDNEMRSRKWRGKGR